MCIYVKQVEGGSKTAYFVSMPTKLQGTIVNTRLSNLVDLLDANIRGQIPSGLNIGTRIR